MPPVEWPRWSAWPRYWPAAQTPKLPGLGRLPPAPGQFLDGRADPETDQALAESARAQAHRRESKHIHRPEVQTRLAAVKPADSDRRRPFVERIKRQQEVLRLPLLDRKSVV